MTRRRWAAAILVAWVVALGWLAKRELFPSTSARLADAALAVAPEAVFYRLDAGGRQIGFASSTIDTFPDSLRVSDLIVMDVPAPGGPQRTAARSVATLSRTLRLTTFTAQVEGEDGRFSARGQVLSDSLLNLVVMSGGDSQVARVAFPPGAVLPSLLPMRLAFGGRLRPGQTLQVSVFDPLLLVERRVDVTVGAESVLVVADSADYDSTAMAWIPVRLDSVRAVRLDQVGGGLGATLWSDARGRAVRTVTPGGLTLERAAFEMAYENYRRREVTPTTLAAEPGAVVATTALRAGITAAPEARNELRLRLQGVDLSRLDITGGGQWLAGDTVIIRREQPGPRNAASPGTPTDPALAPQLRSAPLIEVDHPRIQAQARRIVGRDRDARAGAERLVHWVHGRIRRGAPLGAPSALRTLERRAGDCNEATVLYVALARAAGLPARPVAGLLYLDGRFYYHAWPEVHLGDWVAVDPIFDQFPADAGRVRLVVDALARHLDLLRATATLRIDVL